MVKIIKFCISLLLFLTLPLSFAKPLATHEEIDDFHSYIRVNPDASVDITETINVHSDQSKIRHGIVRWLPVFFMDSYGIKHHADYQIQNILLNNKPFIYRLTKESNHLIITIGDSNTILAPGNYTYTLQYRVSNLLNFLKDADELDWNITGTSWDFPIAKAQADIQLPNDARVWKYTSYTGKPFAQSNAFLVTQASPNQITFTTTQPLKPREGLNIAIAWPKGFVHEPGAAAQLKAQIHANRGAYIAFEITLLLFCYYMAAWYLYGRDPRKRAITPSSGPPLNLSPATLRYITRMGCDVKTFTAAIISMATKGIVTILNNQNVLTLVKTNKDTNLLTSEEKALTTILFPNNTQLILTNQSYDKINLAKKALSSALQANYRHSYFKTNFIYFLLGLILSGLALIAAILSATDRAIAFVAAFWLSFWTVGCYTLAILTWHDLKLAIQTRSLSEYLKTFISLAFTLPFFIGEVVGIYLFSSNEPIVTIFLLLIIVLLNIVFYHLLKTHTQKGREIMDQTEGFKLFLSTPERYYPNSLPKTPDLFEKYLPYAIALDAEKPWGEYFKDLLQSEVNGVSYQPTWYKGPLWNSIAISLLLSSYLYGTLTRALSASCVSPSASLSSEQDT